MALAIIALPFHAPARVLTLQPQGIHRVWWVKCGRQCACCRGLAGPTSEPTQHRSRWELLIGRQVRDGLPGPHSSQPVLWGPQEPTVSAEVTGSAQHLGLILRPGA